MSSLPTRSEHGALSTNHGRIEVTWDAEQTGQGQRVRLRWREQGVAINKELLQARKSKRIWFGYLETISTSRWKKGSFTQTFHSDGLECLIEFGIGGQ